MAEACCIAVDWGTSSLRAMLLGARGEVLARTTRPMGILAVPAGEFAKELDAACGAWQAADPGIPVLMSGMIGSQQGWVEAPYLDAPCGLEELVAAMIVVPDTGAKVRIMPGVQTRGADGAPEIMRGEETQIGGIIAAHGVRDGLFCVPGTHSKWVQVTDSRITSFATFMTGECFAVLRDHSILGRLMADSDAHDPAAFEEGLNHAAAPGGLLHRLFATRTLGITEAMAKPSLASFLSGQLIGAELAGVCEIFGTVDAVHLLAAGAVGAPYVAAMAVSGIATTEWDAEAAALAGLWVAAETLNR